ncbi:unnamed protein product [Tuber aestivum]|uniref:Uncharacterized protein n=1 Tax=Tuber aestivum TaxID=59557 RepID=A0A292Q0Z3_9PEZI|nr:unnamed protein product [Tuber aestivum]
MLLSCPGARCKIPSDSRNVSVFHQGESSIRSGCYSLRLSRPSIVASAPTTSRPTFGQGSSSPTAEVCSTVTLDNKSSAVVSGGTSATATLGLYYLAETSDAQPYRRQNTGAQMMALRLAYIRVPPQESPHFPTMGI